MVLPSFLQPTGTETMMHTSVGKKLALSPGLLIKTLFWTNLTFILRDTPNLRLLVQPPPYLLLNSDAIKLSDLGATLTLDMLKYRGLTWKKKDVFELL